MPLSKFLRANANAQHVQETAKSHFFIFFMKTNIFKTYLTQIVSWITINYFFVYATSYTQNVIYCSPINYNKLQYVIHSPITHDSMVVMTWHSLVHAGFTIKNTQCSTLEGRSKMGIEQFIPRQPPSNLFEVIITQMKIISCIVVQLILALRPDK